MDYQAILTRAFNIIKRHRFLWLLGLFTGGAVPNWQFGNTNYTPTESDLEKLRNWQENIPIKLPSTDLVRADGAESLGKVLGDSAQSIVGTDFFWPILVTLLIISGIAIYLSTTARSAIIRSVYLIDKGKAITLGESWRIGHKYFWRQLSLSVIVSALIVLPLLLMVTPIVLLAIFVPSNYALIPSVILFAIIMIGFMIYVSLVTPYAQRMLIIENKRPLESIIASIKFFNQSWLQFVGLYFILMALNIAAGIVFVLALLVAIAILFAIGAAINTMSSIALAVYASIAVVAVIVTLLVYGGIISAFSSTSTTLAFLDRKKSTKTAS
ncbi:MAG: hypothetical protein WCT32_01470 [Patescibacteria group bacterium]|jgi:hypothetical protein